ncbi:MAG: RagB/SusD family nutrient uptake outer membrane protein, partial [Bacteroidales bacterium]|nr:RagB/SusD family nutrient uptake outer membrane protein [Bacteroidales bacterium]
MKKIIYIISVLTAAATIATSCSLDVKYYGNTKSTADIEDTDHPYTTREDIKGQLDAMYSGIKDGIQESGYADFLIYTEALADNAYAGSTTTGEIMALEAHTQDATNKNTVRDWTFYLDQVSNANQVITYMDDITDSTLTDGERHQWVAEAKIWRAYMWFDFCRLYGAIPMVTSIPPSITADNLIETYPLYYPSRTPVDEVYTQIIADLEEAVQYAPDLDESDKFVCSKAMGYGLLARVYSEKPKQDWSKVAEYCGKVEAMNLSLVPNYADLWSWN